jgi:murein L,D-transpeptidase YcbB/YkuD
MKSPYLLRSASKPVQAHAAVLAIIAFSVILVLGDSTPRVWASGECSDAYWDQILQVSWKNWPQPASNPPRSTNGLQPRGEYQGSSSLASSGNALSENDSLAAATQQNSSAVSWESMIREALAQELLSDTDRELILEAYQERRWEPLLITPGLQPSAEASKLIQRIGGLESDAIDTKPYQPEALQEGLTQLGKLRKGPDPAVKSSLRELLQHFQTKTAGSEPFQLCQNPDLSKLLQTALASSGSDIRRSATAIQASVARWHQQLGAQTSWVDVRLASNLLKFAHDMQQFPREQLVAALTGKASLGDLIRSLEPSSPHYPPLRSAYLTYRNLARKGTQKIIHAQASVRPGARGPLVHTLQERLQEEGYYQGDLRGHYDAATVEAVKRFQAQHLQDADGVLGAKTVLWLNVSYEKKAKMIEQSLEALRKSEARQFDRFVLINVPQFVLEYFKDGKLQSTRRVIVGKASGKKVKALGRLIGENHTPTLVSKINQVIFNPRWYVSDRISLELGLQASDDPNYFDRLGYVRMASTYPWGAPRLYQRPGPSNPLGRVKFEFPNPYAVFLHDTPKKQLFRHARRDFSHGCMRLEGAVDFAQMLLKDDQNPTADKTGQYLADNQQKHIELQHPVPIIIEYSMASSDTSGHIVFCGDPYNWFEKLG